MNAMLALLAVSFAAAPIAVPSIALPPVGEEIDVTAGAVTATSCAYVARDQGDLRALTGCDLAEATKEIVVYDVAEKQIYRLVGKQVARWQLEGAFGGGSVDFIGKVTRVDKKAGIAVVEVEELTVTPKPKAGGFKGCL